jgi:hypothetical protein
MTYPDTADTRRSPASVLADLRELIDAIDRRAPHLEPERERRIGREAAALRRQAQDRIAEIEASLAAAS